MVLRCQCSFPNARVSFFLLFPKISFSDCNISVFSSECSVFSSEFPSSLVSFRFSFLKFSEFPSSFFRASFLSFPQIFLRLFLSEFPSFFGGSFLALFFQSFLRLSFSGFGGRIYTLTHCTPDTVRIQSFIV